MTGFEAALVCRAAALNIELPPELVGSFETYLKLLARWNRTVNLTALPLEPIGDEAVDRLLLEPVAAAAHISTGVTRWVDLGSGGGSPAIPLKLLRPTAILTMVEGRSRKVAFLREAIRELRLAGASALHLRFEAMTDEIRNAVDLVTVRAVTPDEALVRAVLHLLRPEGELAVFGSAGTPRILHSMLELTSSHPLLPGQNTQLSIYRRSV